MATGIALAGNLIRAKIATLQPATVQTVPLTALDTLTALADAIQSGQVGGAARRGRVGSPFRAR